MDLDLKDRKILYELELNGRISETALAKKIKQSREVVRYRLQKLQKDGIINCFNTIVNNMKLNFLMFRTYFKFVNITKQKEQEIIDYLMDNMNWITRVEGTWNLSTMVFTRSVYEYDELMKEFKKKFGNYIQNSWVSVMTKLWHFKRGYLLNEKKSDEHILMGLQKDEQNFSLDQLDKNILNIIVNNARIKTIDISRKLSISEKLVRDRINNLKKNRIILGFTTLLNINKLNKFFFKVHFKLKNYTEDQFKKLIHYAKQHPNIAYVIEAVGGADFEIEGQAENNKELYKIIGDIKTQFNNIILDYYFMEYTDELKFDYLPRNL
jgi:DNA-binding Lrp family transcriptional regulator